MNNLFKIMFLLVATISHGQFKYDESIIATKTKNIVAKIAKENRLTDKFIGSAGSPSHQYENFEKLKNASATELVALTNHPNGVVRCYAFWALGLRSNVDVFEIVKEHLNDDEIIEYQSGCIIMREKVGDFYISLVTPNYVDLAVKKLTDAQRKNLDSLLIYLPNELNSKYVAIENAAPTAELYPILRKLYLDTHNQSALVKLSVYKREEEITLILANRQHDEHVESGYFHTYRAIQNFPRLEFLPFLEARLRATLDNTHFSQEWRELYAAIAMYKNEKAVELLNIPFSQVVHKNLREYHLDFIYDAILENYDQRFAGILWEIWEGGQNITPKGYRFYVANDIKRAYNMTISKLGGTNNHPSYSPISNYNIFTENLAESMLNFIILNNQDLANQIIKFNIGNANVHDFPIYTSAIKKNKLDIFIEPLFDRLAKEWNPHIYLDITQTLIGFQNNAVNARIITMRKVNGQLNQDWGGKALTQLLNENNIR